MSTADENGTDLEVSTLESFLQSMKSTWNRIGVFRSLFDNRKATMFVDGLGLQFYNQKKDVVKCANCGAKSGKYRCCGDCNHYYCKKCPVAPKLPRNYGCPHCGSGEYYDCGSIQG